jgi:cell division protein FtsW (lipid II flippase)
VSLQDANRVMLDLEAVKRDQMKNNYMLPVIVAIVLAVILVVLCILMIIYNTWSEFLGYIALGVFLLGFLVIAFLTYRQCQ